jgi:hypothetical protein
MLQAFKDCFATANENISSGEEVDYTSICTSETEALIKYTIKNINYYKEAHPSELSEKKQSYYVPK